MILPENSLFSGFFLINTKVQIIINIAIVLINYLKING
jgi:hypothetical protein